MTGSVFCWGTRWGSDRGTEPEASAHGAPGTSASAEGKKQEKLCFQKEKGMSVNQRGRGKGDVLLQSVTESRRLLGGESRNVPRPHQAQTVAESSR